ncbi:hypothetical protein HPB47_006321 [Ixodes persulcatus]|uniref:Uncharacterized protein n=1 Tax=Ixodes persulcatus TaxID=34615 RepID=A0AC60PBC0_IXOPE|nr:hypothetical protein HPB47_006321 [Ixodes persulcatus]
MEHWGLITFREVNLLYDSKLSSPRNKQRVAAVIGHELAHMWFGNLVTMKWWDDLWLNEGFASYIEYKGIDHVEPDWDMMNQFLTEDLQPVMDLDSTTTSHPVVQSVSHPDEITEIFDTISYNKGASVLRMLENFLGPTIFQKGVSSFLTHHQFGNAKTSELWDELSMAAGGFFRGGHNVSTIMDTWTRQMGYPVVTMTRSSDDPTLITVVQERFLRNAQHVANDSNISPFGYKWSIPLSYKTSAAKNKVKLVWIHNERDEFHIHDAGRHGWVKFNVNQTGYYLVNYDPTDWQRLGEVLQKHHEELTPADRSNLLYDAFQLAWSGRLSYDVLFNMTQYLIHEMHLIPWSTAHGSLLALSHLLENTEVRRPMQTYIRKLVDPLYKTLGWEDSDKHMNKEVPRNIRGVVYRYGIYQSSGDYEWQFMWEKYLKEVSAQERINLLYGLAHVRSPPLIHRFSLNDRNLGNVVKTICDYFTKQFDYNEMQAFFLKNPNAGAGKRAREQALENVRNNIAWIMLHEPKVARWLTTNIIPEPWESIRLPRHVIPISYDIRLEPVLAEDLVHGSSSIRIAVAKATNVLMVHIKNINVSKTKVKRLKRGNFEDVSMDEEPFLYAENDFWVVQSKDVLAPGVYILEFEFSSSMLNNLRGIFRTSYWDAKTQSTKYMVTSQFQPTFARMAFPCFDEPSFKANFTITVVHAPDMKAISNMPVKETRELDDTRVATKFQESHKMTTYLVAVVVCDFDYLSGVTSNGTPVRVYAREEMLPHAKYALSSIIQVLELFEQQFAIQFPLPKIDHIAIPDPQAAAMENWGLVTYSEFMLLYNPNTTSVSDHHNIAEIVSHELAHMWFGNLVTMKWWDDLWLNEGFATYNSYKGIELIEPSWDANYLKNRKRSNAVTLDLWKSLENVSTKHQHITTIMNTWTRQMGFPYVSVRKGPGNSSLYQVSQQRFLLNPDDATNLTNDSPFRYIWEIPLTFKTSEKRVGLHWLRTNNTDIVKIPLETQDSWVKFNSEFKGYYLVKYDLDDLKLFAETLSDNHEELSASDRAELILETFLLARAGVTPYPAAMDLTRYLRRERHFIPLTAASRVLRHIAMCMRDYPERDLFQMEQFFDEYTEAGMGKRARLQALETVRGNIRWRAHFPRIIVKWIKEYQFAPWENLRLPTHVVPVHYDLQLQPFLEEQWFQGQVDIEIELLKPVSSVSVHSKNLNITSAFMTAVLTKTMVPLAKMFFYEENEFYVMQLDTVADIGKYSLHYEFRGSLTRDLRGLYLSSYQTPENETRYLATTQFEPTDARKAFPCFDEPRFKATFSIKLIHDPAYIALSNMPVIGTEITTTGLQMTHFEKTVKMTTYLVAVIVCDFTHISGNSSGGVQVRIFARKDEIDKTEYALGAALKVLTYFEEYFAIKYPLPKLDLIAIPDFSSGAMENWGLITFREARLLYGADTSSSLDVQNVCRVIAHEIAHMASGPYRPQLLILNSAAMWFGNLVTMQWWDDLWLNEGFASYIQYKGMNHAEPEWESKYLKKHEFGNTITFDLWDELEASSSSLYVRTLLTEVLKGLTFSDTGSHLERLMRSIVYKIACRYGEKTCLHAASDALKGWLDGELLEPNFKDIVFHYGMKQIGDEATWELLFERFLNEPNHAEKGKMITGLGQVQNKALLTRFLNYTFDESKIRGQDIVAVFLSVSKNPAGHEVLWRFLRDNWKSIVKKYAANSRIPGNLIKVVCGDFNTKAKMKENNIDWISKFEPKVSESVRVLLS